MFLVLKLCPIQVVISLPLWTKLIKGQLLLFFLSNSSSFFSYVGIIHVTNHFTLLLIDRYILAIQQIIAHKEHLRYSFWCIDLLNCLRSLETMVITTESGWNTLKFIFTEQFVIKVAILCCFDVWSVRPPQIFHVQAKISTVRLVFSDYLSISYDNDGTVKS